MKLARRAALAALVTLTLSACQTTGGGQPPAAPTIPGFAPLTGHVAGQGRDELIVLVHGDVSRGGAADYMYPHADRIAAARPGATVVAVLRPGYYDKADRRSPGSNNNRRDHYTAVNNALLAETIGNLKAAIKPARTYVLGHSGGAAQLGSVIGQHPGLADGAILLACPCDIGAWRASKGRRAWTNSQSPSDYVSGVAPTTQVVLMTGANDDNTKPFLARDHANALRARGVPVTLEIVPDAGHNAVRTFMRRAMEHFDRFARST